MTYQEFLNRKIPRAEAFGFEPLSPPHHSLKGHQRDEAEWMVRGGRRACFNAFGLGKTRIHLQVALWVTEKEPTKKYLITCPLGVRHQFIQEDGPAMGVAMTFCRTDAEVDAATTAVVITNFESVREGKITIDDRFAGWGLDEASVLRSYGSKTYQNFLKLGRKVPYRFVFTATPSPNKHKELIHYGGFLGVMDTGEALTRFFKRDSTQANNLTLYPHMEEMFWLWLSSWAVFMQRPSDLGYDDTGYDLPPMNVHWHCIPVDHHKAWALIDSWGQRQLFQDKTSGLKDTAEIKRETMALRLEKAREMMAQKPDEHWLLWHDLEDERRLIEKVLPQFKTVYGSQDLEVREEIVLAFSRGTVPNLATKPSLAGSGCNFQRHCANEIFLGVGYKLNDFLQAIHRIYRFQQTKEVNVHVIYSESEDPVVAALKLKWAQHNEIVAKMVALLKKFKLSLKDDMNLTKTMGCDRTEVSSKTFRAIHNDSIIELTGKTSEHLPEHMEDRYVPPLQISEPWPDNCVDLSVTSIPFGNQYEYSPSYHDLGHNPDNEAFFRQMDYLLPDWLRVMKPGRIVAVHTKDRIRFGNVTGKGVPTVDRFSDKCCDRFEAAGFNFLGRITIDTDVVRENNQTYRLGWTENSKDSTKMGCGMPEYVLIFRKPQTDTSAAYADIPVTKDKEKYMRADWQIDASGFWKSGGDRLPDPEILLNLPHKNIISIWKAHAKKNNYRYKEHVEVGRHLEKLGKLPASFMLFPHVSLHPDIWTDILRMHTLNSEQSRRNEEHHVCPLQLDIAERLINRYSNSGEIVYDPFMGIGTVPYQAILMGRIGWGSELSEEYFRCAVGYLEMAERQRNAPTLFDLQMASAEMIAK